MKALIFLSLLCTFASSTSFAETLGFRFRPIFLLVGFIDINLDLPVGEKLRFTPGMAFGEVEPEDEDNATLDVKAFGLDLSYHFDGPFSQGWYTGAYTGAVTFEYESRNLNQKGELDINVFGLLGGYQWMWESFYMSLDARVGIIGGDKEIKILDATTGAETGDKEDTPTTSFNAAYRIGWRF